ncbi:MAG: peptidoglycan-binding protein [Myxococcota bacterium]
MTKVDVHFDGQPVEVRIDALTTVGLPARVFRGRLTGMLFDTDKTFLLPSAMHGIRGLKRYYDQHPGLSVLVTGHSDTVGDSAYNEGLSKERAESMGAYLTEDVDDWLARYGAQAHSRAWGTTEDQHMLSVLPDSDAPHYVGPVHGVPDAPTRQAVRDFQQSAGLSVDGVAGPQTRRALCERYMALDGTTLPAEATLQTHGCGEHHLAVPTGDGVDEPENRRVEVFLFEGDVDPPPRASCGNCPEYPQWLARLVETVDFTDDPGWLDIGVVDALGEAVPGAAVRLEGVVADQQHTPQSGLVRFASLPVGAYQVIVVADDFEDAVFEVGVTPGEPPPLTSPAPPDDAVEDAEPSGSSFVQGDAVAPGGTGGGSIGAQVGLNAGSAKLATTDATVHIVGEVPDGPAPPGLFQRVREESITMTHGAWSRISVTCTWKAPPNRQRRVTTGVDTSGKVVFKLDPSGKKSGTALSKQGVLNRITAHGPASGATAPVQYTLRDPSNPKQILVDPPVRAGRTTKVKLSTRTRTSLWAATNNITPANLAGMQGIDDLSVLSTLTNVGFRVPIMVNGTPTVTGVTDINDLDVEWDDSFRTGANANKAGEIAFYSQIIQTCHSKGVQALVGFQHALNSAGRRAQSFHRWMVAVHAAGASGKTAIDKFAKRLVDRFVKDLPDFDGITFDIEHIAPVSQMPIKAQAAFFTHFYRAVAKRLVPHRKFIAIAVGEFDNQLVSIQIKDKQERFDHVSTQNFAKTHPYQLALGHPNIILRPMAFGRLSAQKGVAPQQQWHQDIVDYALSTVGLAPEQFQLGFEIGNGLGRIPLTSGGTMKQRCSEMLRPNRLGIIGFALAAQQNWAGMAAVDSVLNPDEKPPGTQGQPLQSPRP